jgi:hypothetical protein
LDLDTIDFEVFVYHIMKVGFNVALNSYLIKSGQTVNTTPPNVKFDLIVDFTEFSSTSEIPLHWLRFCAETIPRDVWTTLLNVYALNPNDLSRRYLRRVSNVSAGVYKRIARIQWTCLTLHADIPYSEKLRTCISIHDLVAQHPHLSPAVAYLSDTCELSPFRPFPFTQTEHLRF